MLLSGLAFKVRKFTPGQLIIGLEDVPLCAVLSEFLHFAAFQPRER